jgi:hypothetical protein
MLLFCFLYEKCKESNIFSFIKDFLSVLEHLQCFKNTSFVAEITLKSTASIQYFRILHGRVRWMYEYKIESWHSVLVDPLITGHYL